MKTLYIIRHAKSDRNDPSLSDFERPLNTRGEKNALFMGNRLAESEIYPDLILSSPAIRAKKTAETIAEKIGYPSNKILFEKRLYMADSDLIADVVKEIPDSADTVFIIGHNPGLTEFAESISGYAIGNIPTCGIFCVTLKKEDWKNVGNDAADYVSFEYPKKYKTT